MQLEKDEIYERRTDESIKNISALRKKLVSLQKGGHSLDDIDSEGLLPLKQIMLARDINLGGEGDLEAYTMLDHSEEPEEVSQENDKTLIVKRMHITFNDRKCLVLNFMNITSEKQLKVEREKSRQLTMLSTTVHHEMLGPLRCNVEFAE